MPVTVAFTTLASAIFSDGRIRRSEFVAVNAVRLFRRMNAAAQILTMRHDLKMFHVDAGAIATEMIYLQSGRNRTMRLFPCNAMSIADFPSPYLAAIAIRILILRIVNAWRHDLSPAK
jgi:hypothetical protein